MIEKYKIIWGMNGILKIGQNLRVFMF